jgi:hypothetical protein
MSRPSGTRGRRKQAAGAKTSDGAVYFVLALIGIATVAVAFLLEEGRGQLVGPVIVGYCAVMGWFAHNSAWAADRGRRMANWRRALARLILRCAGFGTKTGKPLAAAHNVPAAKKTIMVSGVFTIVILGALALWLIPPLRPW